AYVPIDATMRLVDDKIHHDLKSDTRAYHPEHAMLKPQYTLILVPYVYTLNVQHFSHHSATICQNVRSRSSNADLS
ncbi:hypothetical protein, partial [Escherichia coli]|uniref:hypothetical protein n=1 Tax=Escherichia coli TaxID=562 RepID=UPI003EB9BF28